jgi:hypothetical protein
MGLYFYRENIEYGIACSILASIGYAGSAQWFFTRGFFQNEWTK